jgi:hypothetical protein
MTTPASTVKGNRVEIDWKLFGALRLLDIHFSWYMNLMKEAGVEIDWKLFGALRQPIPAPGPQRGLCRNRLEALRGIKTFVVIAGLKGYAGCRNRLEALRGVKTLTKSGERIR